MGNAIKITDATFEEQVINSDTPVLVDFWAEWCGPCKMIAPVLDEIATELNLRIDEELLVVRKLFLADNQPVILAHNYVPTKYITLAYQPEDLGIPIYEFLGEYGRQLFSYYLAEIVPSLASNELAQTFQIAPQTPLIALHEIGYNDDNNPILKSTSCFRDDLLRSRLIRRQSA